MGFSATHQVKILKKILIKNIVGQTYRTHNERLETFLFFL